MASATATKTRGAGGAAGAGARAGGADAGAAEAGAADAGDHGGWGAVVDSATSVLAPLLAELDPERLTGGDAVRLYRSFVAVERLAMAGKTLLAPRIDASGVWQHAGHRHAASLIAELEGVSTGQARAVIEVGRRLEELPRTEDALRQGSLSPSKVAHLTDAGILEPAREGELLQGAADQPLQAVKERCGRIKATSAQHDPLATIKRIRDSRCFASWTDAEGAFCYQGKDTADRGARILNHLAAEATRLRKERQGRPDQAAEPERAVRADAFFALVTGVHPDGPVVDGGPVVAGGPGRAASSVPGNDPGAGRGSAGRGGAGRSSSAGRGGAGHPGGRDDGALAGGSDPVFDSDLDPDGLPDDGGGLRDRPSIDSCTIIDRPPACTVMVRVDLDCLLRGAAHPGELCEIDGQGPIPAPMARDLMNDSYLRLIFHRSGDIRSIFHFNRTINRTLRTALVCRDTTCVVPGCGARTRLEIDHVIPVTDHGPTTLDNLALLCHHHHFLKTYEGWTLERTGTDSEGRSRWRFEPLAPFGQEPDLGIDTPEARDRWRRAQE
jgi:hypothetical protein